MASFGFKFEGNYVRQDKFGLNKLKSLFKGGSASNDQNIRSGQTHEFLDHKQGVSKSFSHNHVSAGQDEGLSRNKPFLSFSSSVPGRELFSSSENYQTDYCKKSSVQATSKHPALSFSKSLPGHAYNNQACESKTTQTGKLKLSRAGGDAFPMHNDKFRRKAQVWINDHVPVKKRREDDNFNTQRNFNFDDDISLTSCISNPEDHIYEEIDSDLFTSCDEEEKEVEENLLLGISLGRRNNLKFYGSAGWDFGNAS